MAAVTRAMLSKSLTQFSVDGRGYIPSPLFDLRPNFSVGNKDNGDVLQQVSCTHCYTQCPQPCSQPSLTHASAGDSGHSWASLAQSLVGSLLFSPGSWCTQGALQQSVSPVLWKFCNQISLTFKFPGASQFLCWILRLGNLLWALGLLQQCENFFGIIVLQFVGCLLSGSMVGLMVTSSKRIYAIHSSSQVCYNQSSYPLRQATADPCLLRRC